MFVPISTPIVNLPIRDNQFVKTSDLLFEIDPRDFAAALAQTRTNLDKTLDELQVLDKAVESAKAAVEQYGAYR